jgi:hypothetical protein
MKNIKKTQSNESKETVRKKENLCALIETFLKRTRLLKLVKWSIRKG